MLGIEIDYKKRIFGFDLLRAFAIFLRGQRSCQHVN